MSNMTEALELGVLENVILYNPTVPVKAASVIRASILLRK